MILVEATPEMSRDRDRATHQAWGGPVPLAEYQALEARLRGHPWPRACHTLWLLRGDGGEVLTSCETYRMSSLRKGYGPGHSYAVASVYTEPHQRRRGHVTALLERLVAHVKATDADAQAMVLFSDVPLEVYRGAGFTPRPALAQSFDALPGDPRDGVDELLPEDQASRALAAVPLPVGPFAIWPAAAQIDWHLERERIFAQLLGRPRPPACGARLGAGWAVWAAEYRTGQLMLLLVHAPGPGQADALVGSARRAAHAAGLARVTVWNNPREAPWPQGRLEDRLERLGSVPMIRPLDPGVRAEDWNWIPRALWL